MYEDFKAEDRWTGEAVQCTWRANVVAIATRHVDATDIRFDIAAPGAPARHVWIALPNMAWVEHKRQTGFVITDYAAAQAAGRFLKALIERADETGRDLYTMTVDEVLANVKAVVEEAGSTRRLPSLPVIDDSFPAPAPGSELPQPR